MPERYIKRIRCGNDNCFIVRQDYSAILVDTGGRNHRQKVLDESREEDVCLIVITHGHYGHVCNAVAVADDLDIPIAMHAGDVDLIKDNRLQHMHANSLYGYLELFFDHKSHKRKVVDSFVPDIYITEGYSLKDFGIDAKVVELPGHTLGSIGLDVWGTDFIAGDAVISTPSPGPAAVYGNRMTMEESCDKLYRLGRRTVHCGRGEATQNCNWTGAPQTAMTSVGHAG